MSTSEAHSSHAHSEHHKHDPNVYAGDFAGPIQPNYTEEAAADMQKSDFQLAKESAHNASGA